MLDSGTISAVVAVVGLALTMVALFASWRVSRRSVSTQLYRETASAWEAKSKAQDVENAELRNKLTARDSQIADLTGRVAVLQDTVTGARAWDTLERRTAEMLSLAAETRAETRQIHDETRQINQAAGTALRRIGDLGDHCSAVLERISRRLDDDGEESR